MFDVNSKLPAANESDRDEEREESMTKNGRGGGVKLYYYYTRNAMCSRKIMLDLQVFFSTNNVPQCK